jgi:hypothetical protein
MVGTDSVLVQVTAIVVFIGATSVQVLMQSHRDHVISRITGTRAN